jgi:hypothetical protein
VSHHLLPVHTRVHLDTGALLFGIGLALCVPWPARAGSARDYLSAPIDSWLAFYNAAYATSVTPEDGLDVAALVRTNVLSQSVSLTRTMDYFGHTGGLTVILPYTYVESSSGGDRTSVGGISDVGFLWQINLFGAPALTREQFRSFVPQTFASFHLFVAIPLGEYEPTRALNPSANRWTVSPTVNYSYTPDSGWTWLETYLSMAGFTPNNDFLVGGSSRLTQNPLFIVEGHVSRNVNQRLWLSADAYYNVGGETSIDSVQQSNAASTLRLGGGVGLSLWSGGDLIFNYEGVVAKPPGQPNAQTFRLTLRQFW